MNRTLRLSLLYLLLIIPQHGNSPIPRMESWMEMDQGDGFVDRDLTSSLTGAESFGSAHKNYQNALIRKKQTDDEDESGGLMENFSGGASERVQRMTGMAPNMMSNQYPNYAYNSYFANMNNGQNQMMYEMPRPMNGFQGDVYRIKLTNKNDKAANSKFRSQRYMDMMPTKELRSLLRGGDKTAFGRNPDAMAKCSLCESRRAFDPEAAMMGLLDIRDNREDENEYATGNDETLSRVKNELREGDLREMQLEGSDPILRYGRDEDEETGIDDNEYYSEDRNQALVRGEAPDMGDIDYSQINPHGIIYKREENKAMKGGAKASDKGEEVSQGSIGGGNKLKGMKGLRSDTILEAVAPKESHEITKTDTKALLHNNDMVWKLNSNLQSKELNDVMRDSQRALEEVQMYQQKLAAKPQYNYANTDWKADNYLREQKRSKREDEDEQKNMKTGTDEGGGEYEDEEGKGHNDEEEYYEEAEISGGKARAEGGHISENLNQKFYKREIGKDSGRKQSKEKEVKDLSSEDYELNLENAPVEHEDKSKKSNLREGANGKKVVARKGAKIWDQWGRWSPCSVTCGVGRMTRWRHCIGGGCAKGEKEAQIKKCTNPAC